jgi:bacterial/archaeal transporter family-2 protein
MITGLLGIGIGIGLAMQTAVNSKLRSFVVSPYLASMVSFVIGTLFLAIAMLILGEPFGISMDIVVNEPIWIWFGGICGVIYLTVNILLFPKLGSVQTTILPILGQIIMGMLIDHFGWFRSMEQSFDIHRGIGVILVLSGILFAVALQDLLLKRGMNNIRVGTIQKSQASLWIWRLMGVGAGMLIACQFAINGELGNILHSPVRAAFTSFLIGTIALIATVILIDRTFSGLKNTVKQKAPWWIWIGGILGSLYVLINVYLVGQFGTGQTVILVLFGQVTGSLLVAQFGLLNSIKNKITWVQIIGLILMLAGIIIVQLN